MLQILRQPPPMPHAVFASRPSLHQLPHQLSETRLPGSYLSQPVVSSTKSSDLLFQRDITPPSDMSMGIQYGRANGSQHHLTAQREGMGYGSRPQSQLYSSSNPPVSHQSNGRPYSALPSPTSQRSSKAPESVEQQSKTSDSQVAPSLRIPDTIRTPQSGLPQLAAEVCQMDGFHPHY